MKYPNRLSSGANHLVIALSEVGVAKLFVGDTRSDIGSEAEKMKFTNAVNGLVVRFIRLDFGEEMNAEMLVMERLRSLDFRSQLREQVGPKIFDKYLETERQEMALFREYFLNR